MTPTPQEQAAVLNLMTKVNAAIEKLIVAPDLFTAAVSLDSLFHIFLFTFV